MVIEVVVVVVLAVIKVVEVIAIVDEEVVTVVVDGRGTTSDLAGRRLTTISFVLDWKYWN